MKKVIYAEDLIDELKQMAAYSLNILHIQDIIEHIKNMEDVREEVETAGKLTY